MNKKEKKLTAKEKKKQKQSLLQQYNVDRVGSRNRKARKRAKNKRLRLLGRKRR